MTRRAKLATGGALVIVALGLTELASAPPQNPQPAGPSAIFSAVKADDVAKVKTLVDAEPGLVRARDDTGRTPLHWAARGGSVSMLALLVDKGAEVNAVDRGGSAPLHSLASAGNTEGLRLLLDRGAEVNLASAQGETALHLAAVAGRVEAVRLLIARKADIERANSYGRTPLVLAAREMGGIDVIRVLLDAGAKVDAPDKYGDTALSLAAWRGSADVVDLLLDRRASVPSGTPGAVFVLDNAVSKGLPRLFHLMVEKGADLTRDLDHGRTLMHSAAEGGSVAIVETLARRGFDITRADAYGWTPLHFAVDKGRADAAAWLLAKGAPINARTTMGQSAFNVADENADAPMKALLQARGADTSAPRFPELRGPYLGQKPPGRTPGMFAPGIVSACYGMHSNVVFSPDGTEALWSLMIPPRGAGYSSDRTMVSRLVGGRWTYPQPAVFDGVRLEDVPFFHPDGRRLYDMARRVMPASQPGTGEHIWMWEKGPGGWTKPRPLDATVNNLPHHWQFSIDRAGTLYFNSTWGGTRGIFRARLVNGRYTEPESLGPRINGPAADASFPFIAPDGSYLLFTRRDEIFVSFAGTGGEWGDPISLGSDYQGMLPIVSPDGKYLFVSRYQRAFWVDAGIIQELRRR